MPNFCSISPEERFEKKNNVTRENLSVVFFRLSAKNAGKLPKKLLAAFRKLKVTYPRDQILSPYLMFDDPFCQFPTFWQRFFGRFVEIAFFERWGSFWKKKIFRTKKRFLKNFGFRAKKSLDFRHKKSAGMTKLRSISSREHFEENKVVQKKTSVVFFKFERWTLGRCSKTFDCVL